MADSHPSRVNRGRRMAGRSASGSGPMDENATFRYRRFSAVIGNGTRVHRLTTATG